MQLLVRHIARLVQKAPVGLADVSGFCSHPTQVATIAAVVPDEAFRLQFTDHAVGLGPLVVGCAVYFARFISSAIPAITTIGAIEPHLEHLTIFCQQFPQLVAEIGDVFRPSVFGVIAIPW